ncbi:hypothetical protein VNI00_018502 [Paramarasmius palmivorus]|uniref:Uncharacterized protein n=1 Tax=Paramarasmius palmivorus TaxID=297713 RepID=A0AAW0AYU5_9AGAR
MSANLLAIVLRSLPPEERETYEEYSTLRTDMDFIVANRDKVRGLNSMDIIQKTATIELTSRVLERGIRSLVSVTRIVSFLSVLVEEKEHEDDCLQVSTAESEEVQQILSSLNFLTSNQQASLRVLLERVHIGKISRSYTLSNN